MRREGWTHQTFLAAMREILRREPLPPPRVVYALPDDRYKARQGEGLTFKGHPLAWDKPDGCHKVLPFTRRVWSDPDAQ